MYPSTVTFVSLAFIFLERQRHNVLYRCVFPLFGCATYNNPVIENYLVALGSFLEGKLSVHVHSPFLFHKYGPLRFKSSYSN